MIQAEKELQSVQCPWLWNTDIHSDKWAYSPKLSKESMFSPEKETKAKQTKLDMKTQSLEN